MFIVRTNVNTTLNKNSTVNNLNLYFFVFNRVKPYAITHSFKTILSSAPPLPPKKCYSNAAFKKEFIKFYELLKIIVIFKLN